MELTESQKKVLDFLKGTKANITEIAEGTGIAQPHVSKIVGELKDMEVVETESVGNQTVVSITEGVTVTDEEAIVPISELPFFDKCLKAFQRFFKTKKERRNIDILMEMIRESHYNQSPQGLDRLLADYGIDASRTRLILQYIFGRELEQPTPYAPYTTTITGARPQSFAQPGQPMQQAQPVSIQPGGAAFIPPTAPGGGAYIISLGREGGQQQAPAYGPGERIIRREVSMRTRRRPVLDEEGKPMKDPDTGQILYEEFEEPVVLGGDQQQVDIFKLTDHIWGLVEKARSTSTTPPSVDTKEIAEKVKEGLQDDLERISDSTESVKSRMDTIERELEIERRVKARLPSQPQAQAQLSDRQFELTQQRELIERTVAPDLRGMRRDIKDVFLLQIVSKLEEQRGLQPGTLLSPYVAKLGITEGIIPEEGVTEAEKQQLIARARTAAA